MHFCSKRYGTLLRGLGGFGGLPNVCVGVCGDGGGWVRVGVGDLPPVYLLFGTLYWSMQPRIFWRYVVLITVVGNLGNQDQFCLCECRYFSRCFTKKWTQRSEVYPGIPNSKYPSFVLYNCPASLSDISCFQVFPESKHWASVGLQMSCPGTQRSLVTTRHSTRHKG